MSEIPASPPPQGPPPVSGGGGPSPMGAPLGLNGAKGAGGAGGGGGGGGASKQDQNSKQVTDEVELNTLGSDYTAVLKSYDLDFPIGKMTLQAALSHLSKNGEAMAPTLSERSALKKLLKDHGIRTTDGGGARIDHFEATEAVLEQLGDISGDLTPDIHLQKMLNFDGLADDELLEQSHAEPQGQAHSRLAPLQKSNVLTPACAFTGIEIAEEFQPTSETEEMHLRELITDPRSGFAPEGLDALDLECSQKILLSPVISGRSDFTEQESNAAWMVVALSPKDENFNELIRASKEAETGKMHVLLNASAIEPTPRLVSAIRNSSTSHPKVRVHLSMSAQG